MNLPNPPSPSAGSPEAGAVPPAGPGPAARPSWLGRIAVAGALAGTLVLGACGHFGWSQKEPSERIAHAVERIFDDVDASDAQKARITEIATAAWGDLSPARQQWRDARGRALELLSAERVDPAALEALRRDRLASMDVQSARLSQALVEIAEVLTPAQRAQLREELQSRHRRWGDR